MAFGFGRRICPGRFLADASIFMSMAMLLAAFDIKKARDDDGTEVAPSLSFVPGSVR